jgi:uracil-DNA glycosylase family 4
MMPGAEGVFGGDSGALLDRMMNAIGVSRDQLYLTSLMKTAPATSKTWARKDTARMVPVLVRELQLAHCGLVLVLGEACAQALLKTGRTIPDLLKSPVDAEGLSLSATWHPAEIRAGDAAQSAPVASADTADKKAARPRATQAWEHLQWLRGLLPARS